MDGLLTPDCHMFLFTTPAETARAGSSALVPAIKAASARTGTDFSYLLGTAVKESGLDPQAQAKTSSARGAFQFIEQTWLGMVKQFGAAEGQGRLASAIETRNGLHNVSDPGMRAAILALRDDPGFSSVMAGHLTRMNAAALTEETGSTPKAGDLYAAHVLGAKGAATLLRTMATQPGQPAAALFPQAAKANQALFYGKNGEALSVSALHQRLSREAPMPKAVLAQESTGAAVAPLFKPGGAPLYGLFRTENVAPFAGLDPSGQPARPMTTGEGPPMPPAASQAKPVEPAKPANGSQPLNLTAFKKPI